MARAKAVLAIFAYKRRLPLLQGSRVWYNLRDDWEGKVLFYPK